MRVKTEYGDSGLVTETLHGLDGPSVLGGPDGAAVHGGYIECAANESRWDAVSRWLKGLEHPPKTPRNGIWYVVAVDHPVQGEVLVGILDCTVVDATN
jgi:hypothetical protein